MEPSKECGNKSWNIWHSLPSPLYFSGINVSKGSKCLFVTACLHCDPLSPGRSTWSKHLSRNSTLPFWVFNYQKSLKSNPKTIIYFPDLIAKTPLEDWIWYLTFIWATLGITSSFILQSVTLQWALSWAHRAVQGHWLACSLPTEEQPWARPETAHKLCFSVQIWLRMSSLWLVLFILVEGKHDPSLSPDHLPSLVWHHHSLTMGPLYPVVWDPLGLPILLSHAMTYVCFTPISAYSIELNTCVLSIQTWLHYW
jgi:hypothetical protein